MNNFNTYPAILLWMCMNSLVSSIAVNSDISAQTTLGSAETQWVLTLKGKNSVILTPEPYLATLAQSFATIHPELKFLGQVGIVDGTFLYTSNAVSSTTDWFKKSAQDYFENQKISVEVVSGAAQARKKRYRRKEVSIDADDSEAETPSFPLPTERESNSRRNNRNSGHRRNRGSFGKVKHQIAPLSVLQNRDDKQQQEVQQVKPPSNVMGFNDPHFARQWNLFNDGNEGRIKGNDINVVPVWRKGINGSGVTVAILDDGVDYLHPDLSGEVWSGGSSFDFAGHSGDVRPDAGTDDVHGTRCAGQVAAAADNGVCGVGVAFGARVAGLRLLSSPNASSNSNYAINSAATTNTDAAEARALNHAPQINHIYSSSWGPDDDGASLDGPGPLATLALEAGVLKGRAGRGSIFVFASGNGGLEGDNCNFDGYANSVYTVAIGAINHKGNMPSYGELCSAHLAVTYSSGAGAGIVRYFHYPFLC
ncbi:Proprotein convertase subtilisin/kexin type 7 [Physocladia obscura]|uniref:Proprotein convertase subtilisin/kexin type 7 n=1 Tax=Physocladia obscura TaxID=109957 RepID=A0AAD5T2L4_9FUNG|nr:Proprotein convertase subtilisin/kexin type 7 [Physocladia obscura]